MEKEKKLTAEKVNDVLRYCLYEDHEVEGDVPPDDAAIAIGIVNSFAFHPGRLVERKEQIREMLKELPARFHVGKGGGSSFLGMCMDKHGHQWGEHRDVEGLGCLAIAAGLGRWVGDRDTWASFPGGMPYFLADTDHGPVT